MGLTDKQLRRAMNIGMSRKEYAEITKRHRKLPLGTVVYVKTPQGVRIGSIMRHLSQEGNRAQVDVQFNEPVDFSDLNGNRKGHLIPIRCIKKAPVITGLNYWKREKQWLLSDPYNNRLQIMVAQSNIEMYGNALFKGTPLQKEW